MLKNKIMVTDPKIIIEADYCSAHIEVQGTGAQLSAILCTIFTRNPNVKLIFEEAIKTHDSIHGDPDLQKMFDALSNLESDISPGLRRAMEDLKRASDIRRRKI